MKYCAHGLLLLVSFNSWGEPGDWLLRNGQIFKVDEAQPWAEAIVVRDDKFIVRPL